MNKSMLIAVGLMSTLVVWLSVAGAATTVTNSVAVTVNTANAIDRNNPYHHGSDYSSNFYRLSWMSDLDGNLKISQLSLPGTHDSLSYRIGDKTKTQTLSLSNQLNIGVRVLDIRVKHMDNQFRIFHGIVPQKIEFSEVLVDIQNFLHHNPSETVLMRLKEEGSGTNNTRTVEDTFKDYQKRYPIFWKKTSDNPALTLVRGKLVLLSNIASLNSYGINYAHSNVTLIQDNYQLATNWDLYDSKWIPVKEMLQKSVDRKSDDKIYINYLSGGGTGSFPYFVASGASSPNGPRLSTGLTTPGFSYMYPDFYREACFIGICSIVFTGTNLLITDWLYARTLEKREKYYIGIIMADFPGYSLVHNVIQTNFKQKTEMVLSKASPIMSSQNFGKKSPFSTVYFTIEGNNVVGPTNGIWSGQTTPSKFKALCENSNESIGITAYRVANFGMVQMNDGVFGNAGNEELSQLHLMLSNSLYIPCNAKFKIKAKGWHDPSIEEEIIVSIYK